ncbi:MAG: HDOD domain-containing protein [Chthoniobacteraceae bacterium]
MTEHLEAYLDKLEYLPPVPTLVLELMSLFNQPDRDANRMVELISHDPAVTAEVLKRCNSVLVRGSEPISNMFEAVFRLGFQEIYFIVVAMFGAQVVETASSTAFFDVQAVWKHSIVTAIAAQVMAEKTRADESLAFTAGILHDVGKVILALSDNPDYLTGRQYLNPSTAIPCSPRASGSVLIMPKSAPCCSTAGNCPPMWWMPSCAIMNPGMPRVMGPSHSRSPLAISSLTMWTTKASNL